VSQPANEVHDWRRTQVQDNRVHIWVFLHKHFDLSDAMSNSEQYAAAHQFAVCPRDQRAGSILQPQERSQLASSQSEMVGCCADMRGSNRAHSRVQVFVSEGDHKGRLRHY